MGSNKQVKRLDLLVGGLSWCTHKHKYITLATNTMKCHMKAAARGLYIPRKQSSNKTDLKTTAVHCTKCYQYTQLSRHYISLNQHYFLISEVCTAGK